MRVAYQLRFIPMVIGFIVAGMSFVNLGGTSIPYQDLPPELYEQYLREVSTAKLLLAIGAVLLLAGVVYLFFIKWLYKRRGGTH